MQDARREGGLTLGLGELLAVFLGEPVKEVLAMAEWALKHEGEASFNPEKILPAWAEKREPRWEPPA